MTSTLNTPAGFSTKHGVKLDTDSRLPFVSDEVDMTTPEERHDEAAAIKSFLSQLTAAAFEGEDREEFLRELEEDIGEELEGLLGMGFEEDAVDEMEGILAAPKTSSNEDIEMSDSQQDEDEDEDEEMIGTDVIKVFLREHSMDFVEEEGLDHEMRGVDIESGSRIDDLVAVGHPVPV